MLKYKSNIISKFLNKLREVKICRFNTKTVYKAITDEIIMRTTNSKLYLHEVRTLYNGPIEIWNAGQKIYDGSDSSIRINLVDNTKDVIIKGYITKLLCYSNQLYTLNLDKSINLQYLNCADNQFSILNVDKNINLQNLECTFNKLTLNSIIQILKSIGKRKIDNGKCYLSNNINKNIKSPELTNALNVARANGWVVYY